MNKLSLFIVKANIFGGSRFYDLALTGQITKLHNDRYLCSLNIQSINNVQDLFERLRHIEVKLHDLVITNDQVTGIYSVAPDRYYETQESRDQRYKETPIFNQHVHD